MTHWHIYRFDKSGASENPEGEEQNQIPQDQEKPEEGKVNL